MKTYWERIREDRENAATVPQNPKKALFCKVCGRNLRHWNKGGMCQYHVTKGRDSQKIKVKVLNE